MILIIDAYNVLKQVISGRDIAEKERARFIAQLGKYAKKKGHKIILVFDGGPDEWTYKERIQGVYVVYSGIHATADDYIKQYMQDHKQYDMLLVSSDRDICYWASRVNVESLDSTAFYGILQKDLEHDNEAETEHESAVIKTSQKDNPELDALMQEGSKRVVSKGEDLHSRVERGSPARRPSKKERKMEKKIKKL